MIRKSVLILLILAGAACSSTDVILSPTSFYGTYTPSVVNSAAASGGMLVEVVGNPFDVAKPELESRIISDMKGAHFGPPVDFVTAKPEGFTSPYRIVLVFDSAQAYTETKLCQEGESIKPTAESGDVVRIFGALCAAKQPLTGVNGRVGQLTGLDDPRFRQLIRQMTTNLLPPFNPDRRNDGTGMFLSL